MEEITEKDLEIIPLIDLCQADLKYIDRINLHRKTLMQAYLSMDNKCFDIVEYIANKDELRNRILNHDIIKFTNPRIFAAYRYKYYPHKLDPFTQEEIDTYYEIANKYHKQHERHHFECSAIEKINNGMYYGGVYTSKMKVIDTLEMICDWETFNIREPETGNTLDWWNSNKDRINEEYPNLLDNSLIDRVLEKMYSLGGYLVGAE